jgi:two-component system, NtrC family, sensor kinase
VNDAPVHDTPVHDTPVHDTPVTNAPATGAPVTNTPATPPATPEGRRSLRVQILGSVGVVVVGLLAVVFVTGIVQARSYLLRDEVRSAESLAQVFAIPVIDALIQGDQTYSGGGDLLEHHIRTFTREVEGVRWVSIEDGSGRVLAHSDPARVNEWVMDMDPEHAALRQLQVPVSTRYRSPDGAWVLETAVPLQVGNRRWGTAFIGFDAEPTRAQISALYLLLLSLTLLAALATLGVLDLFIRRFTGSLRDLVAEVDRIELETVAPGAVREADNEIGFLVQRFEQLKGRLVQSRSDLASAQHQIYQAEKLASVGRLAAGVAHEVNNPLHGIRFCVHGIQSDPTNAEQTERYLGLINEGLAHIESVVQKLLGYARHQPTEFGVMDLNEPIERVLELLAFQIRDKDIRTEVALDPALPPLRADVNLIQEMLLNLLLNSIDAVEEGGRIRVRTGVDSDERVFVLVSDDGAGIEPAHLEQIFEPFFTTKDTGKGTGLGLSVTLGIVELHQGEIRVRSTPGKKTTFTVLFPQATP